MWLFKVAAIHFFQLYTEKQKMPFHDTWLGMVCLLLEIFIQLKFYNKCYSGRTMIQRNLN